MDAALDSPADARSAQPYRERMLAAMADLCAATPRTRDPAVRDRLGDVFARVLAGADAASRRRFAERIAEADWTPPAIAMTLALDELEIAQPVIAASPVLREPELARILARGSAEHRAAVARRPGLDRTTVEAVLDTGEPLALAALAGNPSAELSGPVLRRLVESSRRVVALRAPLVRRGDLLGELAQRMSEWVSDELSDELRDRFPMNARPEPAAETDDSEERLVRKLEAADQLKPGFLLRTLREGKLSLFTAALAALARFPRQELDRALRSERPDLLALACVAVGIDRSVFPTVLELVRSLNAGAPAGGGTDALDSALSLSRAEAVEAFRTGVHAL